MPLPVHVQLHDLQLLHITLRSGSVVSSVMSPKSNLRPDEPAVMQHCRCKLPSKQASECTDPFLDTMLMFVCTFSACAIPPGMRRASLKQSQIIAPRSIEASKTHAKPRDNLTITGISLGSGDPSRQCPRWLVRLPDCWQACTLSLLNSPPYDILTTTQRTHQPKEQYINKLEQFQGPQRSLLSNRSARSFTLARGLREGLRRRAILVVFLSQYRTVLTADSNPDRQDTSFVGTYSLPHLTTVHPSAQVARHV
jgi:hypothetical protein